MIANINKKIENLIRELENLKVSTKENDVFLQLCDLCNDLENFQSKLDDFKKWILAGKVFMGGNSNDREKC